MKQILFINKGNNIDYQCDCLFHGLKSIDEVYVEVVNDNWFMYKGNAETELNKLYGKGYSIANRVPVEKKFVINIEKALEKIRKHAYDYVIYGSIFRYKELLQEVIKYYKKSEIVFVDGEDYDYTTTFTVKGIYHIPRDYKWNKAAKNLAEIGLYFKRELTDIRSNLYLPISFAIPEENVIDKIMSKKVEQAYIYPGRLDTYIYKTEESYFQGYQESKFGVTFKKAGWDCLRHYEILANGCVPYFPDIDKCPTYTMTNFPKNIIKETNYLRDSGKMTDSVYRYYAEWLLEYTRKYLTTKKLANYVLSYLS